MNAAKVCLIGDIVVDVTLASPEGVKLRLGGVVHAARCLWAMNIPFAVRYIAPAYLDIQIKTFLNSLECSDVEKVANVVGAPYVFLINEAKEVGDQGYEFLLRDEVFVEYKEENIKKLCEANYEDALLISGNYDPSKILKNLRCKIHVDVANNTKDFSFFSKLEGKLETIFISTSSTLFKKYFTDTFELFIDRFINYTERIILKENRGGSRGFEFPSRTIVKTPSQTRPIVHSVGVGDVYNAVYVSRYKDASFIETTTVSSWIAAEYAITTYPDDFKRGVGRVLKTNTSDLIALEGAYLPWELRKDINIYLAAPDFDFVDTTLIDQLFDSLLYHNFSPRRPIKENGQMEKDASKARKQELYNKDIQLLSKCTMLVAVLLYDDPGTLIELGLAAAKGIPTIVFDPYNRATNCMLTELPYLVSSDLDEVIAEVFIQGSKLKKDE